MLRSITTQTTATSRIISPFGKRNATASTQHTCSRKSDREGPINKITCTTHESSLNRKEIHCERCFVCSSTCNSVSAAVHKAENAIKSEVQCGKSLRKFYSHIFLISVRLHLISCPHIRRMHLNVIN